ncbi:ATP phosphoribosyltransferase regulatory subunit [Seleniivibrio woodruffii]|uniref:ATP phosphoribosyltransferase regulatory subunit n=1 Tax=Seleniivibrio woodruffii TaxID=1078050 RepID=UPI00240A717E|nr:ATP phosphoribosyltransferase regulatory subunit [Seleniivibrio woodruffii]
MVRNMMPNSAGNIAPGRAVKMNRIERTIKEVVQSYGYMDIFLPIYEYYDMLKDTMHNFRDENIIRFIDRNTGKSLVLRPDFTPQVARYFANYMSDFPLPIRLSYNGRVFRNVDLDKGVKSEKLQVGAELFGNSQLEADTEMLLMARRVFDKLNIDGCKYVFGHSGFTRRALELAGKDKDEYHKHLDAKNITAVANLFTGDNDPEKFLRHLPKAFGGVETVEKLAEVSRFDKELAECVDYISTLFKRLISLGIDAKSLVFDASESAGLEYYTGITFSVLHAKIGESLAVGGRYDNLTENFGRKACACGMVFFVEEIYSVDETDLSLKEIDWLVVGRENLGRCEELRDKGFSVFFAEDAAEKSELETSYNFLNTLS